MSPSQRTKIRRTGAGRRASKEPRTFRPRLSEFEPKGTGINESKKSLGPNTTDNANYITRRGRTEQTVRHMDSIFENFRNEIEGMLNPWLTHHLDRFPRSEIAGQEQEGAIRMPLYDMLDKGNTYELRVELPGVEKDKIHVIATDDSIEISAENSEQKSIKNQKKKANNVYNQLSYTSFYSTIPVPEEIRSSEVTAKVNNGILTLNLPKKTPLKDEKPKSRIINVE
jgi:HSP20 family protein